jgi:pimeloyl-ACP methyl ester carboxylesterase
MKHHTEVAEAMARLLAAGGSAARSVMTRVAGRRLHHVEEGSGSLPVVLLHGGTGGGANWFRLLGPLSLRYRVLAPDLPGFGLSDPDTPRAPLGELAAERLDEWLTTLDLRGVLVVGTSFGGLAALRLAQRSPARVNRLLLLDSAGLGRDLPSVVRLITLPGLTRLGVYPTRRGTAAIFRALLTSNRAELSELQIQALLDYLLASARAAGTAYLARTLRLFAGPAGQREVVTPAELAALPQPIRFVWGERDPFLPVAHAHAAARHCRDGSVVLVPGVGHSPNWERPGAVVAAIDQLAQTTARS